MAEVEERGLVDSPRIEVRAGKNGASGTIVGYSPIFNVLSSVLGPPGLEFREIVREGSPRFKRNLAGEIDVSARIQHAAGLTTVGRTTNNSLKLNVEDVGVRYEVDPPDTTAGRDIATLIEGKYIDKSSFAFRVLGPDGERWDFNTNPPTRELLDIEISDVAMVDGPAYEEAIVEMRSAGHIETALASMETARAVQAEQDAAKPPDPAATPAPPERLVLPSGVDPETARTAQREHTREMLEWLDDHGGSDNNAHDART